MSCASCPTTAGGSCAASSAACSNQRSLSGKTVGLEVFFDPATWTLTYVAYDPTTKDAVIIDPVLDFDPVGWQTSTKSIEKVAEFIAAKELKPLYCIETHVHADHITASQWLKKKYPGLKICIGAAIAVVQKTFLGLLNMDPAKIPTDGSQFDVLLSDGQTLQAGSLSLKALAVPGHTPACMSYLLDNLVFTGDLLFMEDCGCGRCDFPGGQAEKMVESIQTKIYTLPPDTIVCVGHDYPGGKNRSWSFSTTIANQRTQNIFIKASDTPEDFIKRRQARDATLSLPNLIFQSVQINMNAGKLPQPQSNGLRYLVFPLNLKKPTDEAGIAL
eukprot:RCo045930